MTKAEALDACDRVEKDLSSLLDYTRGAAIDRTGIRRNTNFRKKVQRESRFHLQILRALINKP